MTFSFRHTGFINIFIVVLLCSCTPTAQLTSGNENAARTAKTLMQFRSVADMNDAYFALKENYQFEFYRQLFDSVKNSSYPGKFTQIGDTLYLHFYNTKGAELLGEKAVIKKGDILFFK